MTATEIPTIDNAVTDNPANDSPATSSGGAAGRRPGSGSLFGRDLIYVVVWSMQLISAVIVSPVLAYVLGPAEFGSLATAIALYQLLMVVAVIGLDRAITLQLAEDGHDRGARRLLAYGIGLAVVVGAIALATAPLWGPVAGLADRPTLTVAAVLWTAPGAIVMMVMALLMAQDRLFPFAVVSLLSALGGQVFGIGLLLAVSADATTYAWGGVVSQSAAMIVGLILSRPLIRGQFDRELLARAVRLGVPIMISGLSIFVLNAGDRIVLQRELGAVEVGRYQVAYTVGSVIILLLVSTSQAWTPRIAAVREVAARTALIGRSRDELYRLLIPMLLGLTLGAPIALRIVAPASFQPEGLLAVVYVVALSALPVTALGATNRELLTSRRTRPLAVTAVTAAVLNVALNFLLIPYLGILGAAVATVLAFGSQAVLQRVALPVGHRLPGTPRSLLAGLAVAVGAAGGTVLLPQTLGWNVVRLALALACVPWFLIALRRAKRIDSVPRQPVHRSAGVGGTPAAAAFTGRSVHEFRTGPDTGRKRGRHRSNRKAVVR